jgi:hypothetical protein
MVEVGKRVSVLIKRQQGELNSDRLRFAGSVLVATI